MKYLITFLLASLCLSLSAQSTPSTLDQTVNNLKNSSSMQNKMIAELQNSIKSLHWKIDTIYNITDINTANIEIISDTLHLKVLDVHSTAHEKIDAIDEIVSQNKTYWMIGSIVLLLLLLLIYILLNNQIKAAAKEAEYQLLTAENVLKQNLSTLDEKLAATNLALNSNQQKIETLSKDLASTHKELQEVHKALEHSHKDIEKLQQELKIMSTNLTAAQQQLKELISPK